MTFSPQYLVAANLLLLALVAYSASSLVSTVIAGRLRPPTRVQLSAPPPPSVQEAVKPASHYAKIADRDIFNSVKPAAAAPPPPPPAPPPNLKLWGVAVHTDPAASYAIIEDQKVRKQALYGIDDTIEGTDTKVKEITWDRVVLTRGGQDQVLDLEGPAGVTGLPAGVARPSRSVGGQPSIADKNIQMVSENEYLIDRAEVDNAFDNMSNLFTQVRAVPHFEGGRSTGFRLFAIRQGSLFDKIGLKNGDIIQRINDADLNDPSRALALMQDMRNEDELTVEVIRNRQPQTLHYRFR